MESFGRMIAGRRKEFKMSQKDVATRIKKEDGLAISVQYLNDVEHGRRRPPSDLIIRQIARILKLPLDALYFSAARLPPDIKIDKIEPEALSPEEGVRGATEQKTGLKKYVFSRMTL